MLASQRFEKIVEIVDEKGIANTRDLAQILGVTETTIRRDCERLDKQGKILRVHGGAKSIRPTVVQSPQDEKAMKDRTEHYREKDIVCERAASFVRDGDCIFLDGGTSIAPMVKYLIKKQVKIVTHSMLVAEAFVDEDAELFMIGGSYIPRYSMSVGPMALRDIENFNFDYAFIGCLGMDPAEKVLYTAEMETMEIKRAAMNLSKKKFLLLDASKLNVRGFYRSISTTEFDGIICNESRELNYEELPENFMIEKPK